MIITVDTGGTKTLVASFTDRRAASKKHRFATPKDPVIYIEKLTQLLKQEYDLEKAEAIAIAVPGIVKANQVVFCPNLNWRNLDIAFQLHQNLSFSRPILVENDANLASLAEAHVLSPIPATCLYVTISTGIGTGIASHGIIDPGFRLSEGGHMLLEYDGILRHWESFASGRAIYETYGKYARDIDDKATWEVIADKISRGLFVIIPLLHPDTIVFGGSIGAFFPRFHKTLEKILEERLPEYIDQPNLLQASHPEEAVIYGCNLYALQALA